MAFLFYIDGQLTDQPDNDTELVTTIRRDSTLGALLVTQDVTLVYSGNNDPGTLRISGYSYLKNLFDDGICNEAELKIIDQVSPTESIQFYTGIIKVPAMTFDLQQIEVTLKVEDNSFYSYINNNKSIKFNPKSLETKTKQPIAACQVYECDMFAPNTFTYGSTFGFYFYGYRITDLFRYVIASMTDNKVGFLSNYLESPIDGVHLFLFDGNALINEGTQPEMTLSFNDLFNEVNKLKNVSFYIDSSDQDNPILRLENSEFFYADAKIIEFYDIKDLKVTTKINKLYGTVKVGSQDLQYGATQPFNEGTSYYGWKEEVYTPIGQCNLDQELNLVNEFAISSNMVSNQLIGAVDSNLDTLFIVQMSNVDDALFTASAVGFDYFLQGLPRYYNLGLNNVNKLQRHGTNFQSALSNTQEIGGNGFKASLGQDQLLAVSAPISSPIHYPGTSDDFQTNFVNLEPVEFADDFSGGNYDGNGNYSNAGINVGQYLAPSDGNYTFSTKCKFEAVNLYSCTQFAGGGGASVTVPADYQNIVAGTYQGANVHWGIAQKVIVNCYTDDTLTTLKSTQTEVFSTYNSGTYEVGCSLLTQMDAGNVVVVQIESYLFRAIVGNMTSTSGQQVYFNGIIPTTWSTSCAIPQNSPIQVYLLEDSYFECTGTPEGVSIVATNVPAGYMIKQYDFTYPIGVDDFELIKLTPIGLFPFTKDGVTLNGWIESMQRNDQTGLTTIRLITQNDATIS